MFPWQNKGNNMHDQGQRSFMRFVETKNGQGADMMASPHFYLRGQPGPSGTATFASSAPSNTTETVSLSLPNDMDPPEYAHVVLINHADAAVTYTISQTIDDFVAGTGTVLAVVATDPNQLTANGGSQAELVQFPFSTDGPLVVTFTAAANMTNGGKVGAQIRFEN